MTWISKYVMMRITQNGLQRGQFNDNKSIQSIQERDSFNYLQLIHFLYLLINSLISFNLLNINELIWNHKHLFDCHLFRWVIKGWLHAILCVYYTNYVSTKWIIIPLIMFIVNSSMRNIIYFRSIVGWYNR